jgi:hypothetical protein
LVVCCGTEGGSGGDSEDNEECEKEEEKEDRDEKVEINKKPANKTTRKNTIVITSNLLIFECNSNATWQLVNPNNDQLHDDLRIIWLPPCQPLHTLNHNQEHFSTENDEEEKKRRLASVEYLDDDYEYYQDEEKKEESNNNNSPLLLLWLPSFFSSS